ncbi:hypothetical protein CH381_23095 [Leptospira sp. mixed culture ATI2-C-A1]|nr:hypothetical protein CH381_23095 [Leptospira sp. mixed culture ATI2-C-A1]
MRNKFLKKVNLLVYNVIIFCLSFLSFCKSKDLYESKNLESNLEFLEGRASFERNCVTCHGEKGRGDGIVSNMLMPRPLNFKFPANRWKNGNTLESVEKTLFEGIKGSLKVSYKHLGEKEVKQLAKYVVYLSEN